MQASIVLALSALEALSTDSIRTAMQQCRSIS
jgi:hypothetical protein